MSWRTEIPARVRSQLWCPKQGVFLALKPHKLPSSQTAPRCLGSLRNHAALSVEIDACKPPTQKPQPPSHTTFIDMSYLAQRRRPAQENQIRRCRLASPTAEALFHNCGRHGACFPTTKPSNKHDAKLQVAKSLAPPTCPSLGLSIARRCWRRRDQQPPTSSPSASLGEILAMSPVGPIERGCCFRVWRVTRAHSQRANLNKKQSKS